MANLNSRAAKITLLTTFLVLQGCTDGGLNELSKQVETAQNSSQNSNSTISVSNPPPEITTEFIPSTDSELMKIGAANPVVDEISNLPNSASLTGTDAVSQAQAIIVTPGTDTEIVSIGQTVDTDEGWPYAGSLPVTPEPGVDTVNYSSTLVAPAEGELVPYNARLQLVWSIPAVLVSSIAGFDITIAEDSSLDVSYRNNLVPVAVCTVAGSCSIEIDSSELPLAEGENIWSVGIVGDNIQSDIAEATFIHESAPEPADTNTANASIENSVEKAVAYSEDFLAIKADVDAALSNRSSWYSYPAGDMDVSQGYSSMASSLGLQQAYRATNDTTYLDAIIEHALKYIDSGYDMDGDGYWDLQGLIVDDPNQINVDHFEFRSAITVACALMEIKRTSYEYSIAGTEAKLLQWLRRELWEKWAPPSTLYSAGYLRSNTNSLGLGEVGRLAISAMALDMYDPNPRNNQYSQYLMSPTRPMGRFFNTWKTMIDAGEWKLPGWTDDPANHRYYVLDTSHGSDFMAALMLMKQEGYDPSGLMEETLTNLETLLNTKNFKTSAGFTEYTDGTGLVNSSEGYSGSAQGWALTSTLSSELLARWVEFFRYNDPFFNHSKEHLILMGGSLMWALNGGNFTDSPDAPNLAPKDPTLELLEVNKVEGNDYRIKFGFDTNRYGRLEVTRFDNGQEISSAFSDADTTGIWGAPGREHQQWLRGLFTGSQYTIQAQTSTDGVQWTGVGEPIDILTQ